MLRFVTEGGGPTVGQIDKSCAMNILNTQNLTCQISSEFTPLLSVNFQASVKCTRKFFECPI